MELRRIFDTIPEEFDRWRPHYCPEAFADLIEFARLNSERSVLEIGPGTGQATEPVLKTGCDYLAIELGERLAAYTEKKFSAYGNFHLVNADFETYDFSGRKFDLVYSAAAIQWIPEEIGFSRAFDLLNSGGTFAMLLLKGDYQKPNEQLYRKIQEVYTQYFHPEVPYMQKLAYENVVHYGFVGFERREYHSSRTFCADDYISYLGTHSDHMTLREPDKSRFYEGIRAAVLAAGDRIVFDDTIILYLARKP